ncbi:MAG: lamin tail domain-containing protein [Nocardioides sp.]
MRKPARSSLSAAMLAIVAGALLPVVGLSAPAQAADTDIVVNEAESSGGTPGDWIELVNTGSAPIDLTGWYLKDNNDTNHFSIDAGTVIEAGGFMAFDVEGDSVAPAHFGLGGSDYARVFNPDGVQIDAINWTAHATQTFGRCPDGTGVPGATLGATKGAANNCAAIDPEPTGPTVVINEVESNGDPVADWVELHNIGAASVDISGWIVKDDDDTHTKAVPAGTTIAPGGYFALYTELPAPGFGLGSADQARLFEADGTTLVDAATPWTGHPATSWGRCPDGTGTFRETNVSTRNQPNACSAVRINEVTSNSPDMVELKNISDTALDLGGWTIKDNSETNPTVIAAGTMIQPGGYYTLTPLAGLGSADSVRLVDPSGAPAESYTWTAHPATSYGRCADGVGEFKQTTQTTFGGANACPGLQPDPWPGSAEVSFADDEPTFGQDASGVIFDPENPDVLWVAQNKAGTLSQLVRSGDTFVRPAGAWNTAKDPKYVDGTGSPDTEGITIGGDDAIYLSSERDNANSGISRMTVLRYDAAAASGSTITATDQWELNSILPTVGANLGLEGITFVPDAWFTDGGLIDESTSSAYNPASYPDHGDGLYVVAVEGTGLLYALALDHTAATAETAHLVATFDPQLLTNAGPAGVMDVSFDPELDVLWAICDDSCDGVSVQMAPADGTLKVVNAYERPAGMANYNNEGLAIQPQRGCVDGEKLVVWANDGDDEGHALRQGTIGCTPIPVVDPSIEHTLSDLPNMYGWFTAPVTVTFSCTEGSAPLTEPCPAPVVVDTDGLGQRVTATITATDGGTASTTTRSINLDQTAPTVTIAGVEKGKVYNTRPQPICVATDTVSKVVSCTLKTTRTGDTRKRIRFVVTATATDQAGNRSTATTPYFVKKKGK